MYLVVQISPALGSIALVATLYIPESAKPMEKRSNELKFVVEGGWGPEPGGTKSRASELRRRAGLGKLKIWPTKGSYPEVTSPRHSLLAVVDDDSANLEAPRIWRSLGINRKI